jgi:BirA family biotin operon repressor/biotin-[acetyl-CoA-carboxylase] ligase
MEFQIAETASTASTNEDLAEAARAGAPEGTVHATEHQTAGRGRLDREWEAPAGSGLAMSVLLRPTDVDDVRWTWIPLLTGVAVATAVSEVAPQLDVRLKWPNDVEVASADGAWRKLAGILVERIETPTGPAAVVGIGLNIAMTADQLPVPNATSLAIEGADTEVAAVRDLVLRALGLWYGKWQGESTNSTLRGAYLAASGTVGQDVVVTLSDGSTIEGSATDVDEFGRLVVGGQPVGAGDVTHVRR